MFMFKKLFALVFLFLSLSAQAQYSLSNTNGGDGSMVGAYPSFTLTGANNSVGNTFAYYTQLFSAAETVSFNWTYTTFDSDGVGYDHAGYVLNGILTQLSPVSGGTGVAFTGSTAVNVSAGDTFGWYVNSIDSIAGAASLQISAVPEPSTYAMLLAGLGMLGFAARRKRA